MRFKCVYGSLHLYANIPHAYTRSAPPKVVGLVLRQLCCPPPAICNAKRWRLNDRSCVAESVAPRQTSQHKVRIIMLIRGNI